MSERRDNIIKALLKGVFTLPHAEEFEDVDKEYTVFKNRLLRAGLRETIGLSKEKGKSLLWFRRRKDAE